MAISAAKPVSVAPDRHALLTRSSGFPLPGREGGGGEGGGLGEGGTGWGGILLVVVILNVPQPGCATVNDSDCPFVQFGQLRTRQSAVRDYSSA